MEDGLKDIITGPEYKEPEASEGEGDSGGGAPGATPGEGDKTTRAISARPLEDEFSNAAVDLVESIEKFDESTYNKKLERIKTSMGDQTITTDSAVVTIKAAQRVIRESNEFLSKLYNANSTNLWYKEND